MERLETEFLQNDYVVYKGVGVCRIECIETKSFDGVSSSEYLKLVPLSRNGSSYYVPMSFAGAKIRKPMTKEEIHSVIDSVPDTEIQLTRDFRQRKSIIEAILKSDDYSKIIALIKTVYLHTVQCRTSGKKVLVSDENTLRMAENIIYPEFSFVLGIAQEEVADYIGKRLEHA